MTTSRSALRVAALLVAPLVLLLAFTLHASTTIWPAEGVDMRSYVYAGELLRTGGDGLYDPTRAPEGVWPYLYPPAFAAAFAGLASVPGDGGYVLWGLIVFASIVVSLGALRGLGRLRSGRMAILVAVLALPTIHLVIMGQVDALIVALLAVALLADRHDRQRIAGALVGTAAVVKVLPALALLPFMALRRWGVVKAAVITAALASLLPLAWLLPELGLWQGAGRLVGLHVEFVDGVLLKGLGQPSDREWMLLPTNASLPGSMLRLIDVPAVGALGMWLLIAGAVWVTVRTRDTAAGVGLVVAGAALGNFVFWPHSAFLFSLPLAVAFSLSAAVMLLGAYLLAGWLNPVLGTVGYLVVWGRCGVVAATSEGAAVAMEGEGVGDDPRASLRRS